MEELLPDCLEFRRAPPKRMKRCLSQRGARLPVYWNGYSVTVSIVRSSLPKFPERTQDMLGYQALIVEACMEYEGGS